MQGEAGRGKKQRADGVGKELSMVGEAKEMLGSGHCSYLELLGSRGQDVEGLFS